MLDDGKVTHGRNEYGGLFRARIGQEPIIYIFLMGTLGTEKSVEAEFVRRG